MAKQMIAKGQVTIVTQQEPYTIVQSLSDYIFPAENSGAVVSAVTIISTVKVTQGNTDYTAFSIGAVTKPAGFSAVTVNNTNKTITYTVAANTTNLADSGVITIPVIINAVTYSLSFSWSKAKKGSAGPAGIDANLLDWVKDWNTNKSVIGSESLITPKIFAGVKNSNDTITGVVIGKFILKTVNASATLVSETVNGIYGFKEGNRTFSIDAGGNIQIGTKNQIIKYNASTGKIEFGSDVSLNWINTANNALSSAKAYADTKKTEAINSASTDATNKANQAKTDAVNTAATDASNKINALQIGGSNLLNNSGDWRTAGWNNGFGTNGGGYTIETTALYNGKPTIKTLVGTGLQHPWVKLENGIEYTYSAIVKCNETITGNGSTPLHYHAGLNNTAQGKITVTKYDTSVTTGVWKKIYITFKLNGDADSFRPFFYRGTNGTTTYWVANIKLERGNKATDWQPSVSDVAQNISDAKSAGTNAQAIADAITKKANDEQWSTKLTFVGSTGIFTGTLSANTVNAIKINANQITAGTIDAARLNVDALKAALITAANINALTLAVNKGTIGGWTIDGDSIFRGTKNNTSGGYTAASGAVTIGSNGIRGFKWKLDSTGAGAIAGGNISWDVSGNVTFGSSVILNWTNAANTALASAKTYADTKKTEAITAAATDATNKSNAARELAQAMAFGKMLYRDPVFYNGNNGITVYNNSANGTVTIARTSDSNAPNDSKQVLVIKNTGASNPNCGGFNWGTATAYRKIFITRLIAKIPSGRNISYHSNSIGTGGSQKWLTSVAGTGDWCEYICKVSCGTASFSSTHFFAITGTVGTIDAPVEWRIAYATVFDITTTEKYTTTIDATGIYTGTLNASQINAGTINADRIATGSLNATKLDAASIKANIINTDYINGLTCTFVRGKIGGWTIGSDTITTGSIGTAGAIPVQLRSSTTGSGNIFNGSTKLYGLSLLWYQSNNAGHIVFGQVAANGSSIKTGFVGIQMLAWDGTEYFCLSANSTLSGSKEVYNRIAGWAFDNDTIFRGTKNNTSGGLTAASGSISIGSNGIRGFKWRLDSTGAGALAGGNISWDASGNVSFASSVSLNWTNAANTALTSAKTYADTKKTEAISAAATDATGKMNSAKVDGILYCRGTGNNRSANRLLTLNGVSLYNTGGRGLQLTVIKRADLTVQSHAVYDIYGVADKRTELANALNALNDTVIVVLTSYDAIVIDASLANAMARCGGSGLILTSRNPYALVGIPGTGKGNGIEVYGSDAATAPYAEITTRIINGVPQGISSINGRALTLTDNTITALGGTAYPKLTKIDSTGIYTGTLTATQITAGTISADRIAAGSINATKLDAASVKASIINTDYINGLTCTFVRGKIGGWSIGSDTISTGSIGGSGAIPIQIRSSSSGSGYVYSGQYKPYGLTMSWHQNSNAGHFVFGQIMSGGNTVKTGFIGIQMMSWDNHEYFCLSANYTLSGSKETYNRIAGWAFDSDSIYRGTKNNTATAYTAASGAITIGSNGIRGFKWRLDSSGAGAIAGGNISWDASGNVTFGSNVSLNWTNAANTALTNAKTYADTKKTEAINSAATDATSKVNAINIGGRNYVRNTSNTWSNPVTLNNTSNQCIFGYTAYTDGWVAGDTITVSFDYKYDKIVKAGTATLITIQGGGNVTGYTNGFAGHNFFSKINFTAGSGIVKITYSFVVNASQLANASFGLNIRHDYLTGTVYLRNLKVERGTKATDWSPAPEDISSRLTQITSTGVYTGTVKAAQIQVDSALVVGGSSYDGSISVRDASNNVKVTLNRSGITANGGTIGGWVIASTQISKNSVVLGADGTIYNGTKWKLGNDGSGFVANGNVSWTAEGAVSITGAINATSGIIGGFTISGNKLINKAADTSLQFNSLSGASYLSINENTSTLLAMRADSIRTAISIQTYATGAKGITIIANSGSTSAIESFGPHTFGQRSGERWSAPGVLFSAVVKNSSALYNQWGNGLTVTQFSKSGTGYFILKHNLGHTQYMAIANPYWDTGSNWHGNCFVRIEYIKANEVAFRIVNADNGGLVDTCFTFAIIGRNKW